MKNRLFYFFIVFAAAFVAVGCDSTGTGRSLNSTTSENIITFIEQQKELHYADCFSAAVQ
ncbi:MAG: hypothetical protein K9J30_11820 [Bacteroidales bacterium]|nr:hypothetical protein [Bacteroidales bacterium]